MVVGYASHAGRDSVRAIVQGGMVRGNDGAELLGMVRSGGVEM
jgi:hypothetical protein